MRSETIDWSVIRNAMIGLAASIIGGSGLVVGSIYFKSGMQQDFNRNNAQFQNISQANPASKSQKIHLRIWVLFG